MDSLLRFLPDVQSLGPSYYALVFAASFFESLIFTGSFIPGTILVVIAGGLAVHGEYDLWLLVLVSTSAAILGDGISYELGRRGKIHLERCLFFKRHVDRAQPFLRNHRKKSILLGRFIGPMRPFVPFAAGVADMERGLFYSTASVSGLLWSVCYLGLGYVFGAASKTILLWSSKVVLFAILLIGLCIGILKCVRWCIARWRNA